MQSYPTLSFQERDRRWNNVRTLMKEQKLDCLVVPGLRSRERLDAYLSNDQAEGIVVFPPEGEPTYLARHSRFVRHMVNCSRGVASWIEDWRGGPSGRELVSLLKEKGFDSATIGIVGLDSQAAGEGEGFISYRMWTSILESLPSATFIDVSKAYCDLVLVKSEEELALVRYSAWVGEKACETMLTMSKPGVSEGELVGAIMNTIHSHGAYANNMILHSGVDNPGWGSPSWFFQAQAPRILEKGDMVQAELFQRYGGMETQEQMSVALQPVHPINQELAVIARRSYVAGLEALRPGRTFKEVADAMEAPLTEAGCWFLTPLIHSLSPIVCTSQMVVGMERLPEREKYRGMKQMSAKGGDVVIQPGMVFELEPSPTQGNFMVTLGGTVVVTQNGAEELNKLSTEVHVIR